MSTPTTFLTEDMKKQAIGSESNPVTLEVEKGAIIKFAQAIGNDNPIYNDEAAARKTRYGTIIAPPTFLRSVVGVRPELPFDLPFERLLDGGSDWEYFQPVRAGDRITATAQITNIQERTGRVGLMILITNVITYRNQFNEVAVTQTSTTIYY